MANMERAKVMVESIVGEIIVHCEVEWHYPPGRRLGGQSAVGSLGSQLRGRRLRIWEKGVFIGGVEVTREVQTFCEC